MKDVGNARPVLARVATFFDSRGEMAERLNISVITVNSWFRRGHVPTPMAVQVSMATGGRVSIEALVHEANEALRELRLLRKANRRIGVDGPIQDKARGQEGGQE